LIQVAWQSARRRLTWS